MTLAWKRLFTPLFGGFLGHIPPRNVTHCPNPKRTVLGRNHVIWAIKHDYPPRGSSWALEREKKDRTGQEKNSQNGYTSPFWGEAPTQAIYIINCVVGDLDVITCAKFQNEIFRGYHFTGGRIFHFPLIFEWALQLRCLWLLKIVFSRITPANLSGSR